MYIEKFNICNFRNISDQIFRPGKNINVIWGDNAQGKTNVLEAIYLLGTLKSFRCGANLDFIKNGTSQSHLNVEVNVKGVRHQIDLEIDLNGKSILFDLKRVSDYKNLFCCFRPIIFAPEEVLIAKGSPSLRRALVDRAVFHVEPSYLKKVRAYEHCLKQRNSALQRKLPIEQQKPWNDAFIQKGAILRYERHQFLNDICSDFKKIYKIVSGDKEDADITYEPGSSDLQFLENKLRSSLLSSAKSEKRYGFTMVGPHRDDLDFSIDGKPIKNFGSQGQQRSCILAFKTAQVLHIKRVTGDYPILLLDDLNSDLDRTRQDFYFNFLIDRSHQVFITTTDPLPFVARTLENASFFRVVNGCILPA